ncbi:hypothetical protein MKW98_008476 [Papaver atlanticum]|uniref:F-box domain-containing protein n=1 Tax=Papaver atlanticum TaxID=357466 RepID=A0AAD4TI74_9MAGN|nr:hypothetical protein MKW98_008476 [Papaver atlanticum]
MKGKNSGCSSSEEDRISNLPDSLIHHIQSFIDTKFAVQTCLLSKRWRYIWTSIPVLNFCHHRESDDDEDCDDEGDKLTNRFITFVDKVLSLRDNNSDIQRFHLESSLCYTGWNDLYGCIKRWVTAAVSHNVQELHIEAKPDEDFEIPLCLYTCESLTKLDLELFGFQEGDEDYFSKIILPHTMSLPRLKSLDLRLSYILFSDEKLTSKFFSSFPNLESLVIVYWGPDEGGFLDMNLEISLPQLKHFKFNSLEEEWNSEVTLHAPSLSSFIFNSHFSTTFTLENVSSLVTADVEIKVNEEHQLSSSYGQRFMRFFRGLHKVKVLTLRHSFIKALGGAVDILDSQLLEFYNLQRLELRTHLSRDCLRPIFYVLKISPNLESDSMQISKQYNYDPEVYPYFDEVKINPENMGDYWDARLSSQCMLCHLNSSLRGCIYELKFLEVLLKHATILEKVVLAYHSTKQDPLVEKWMKKFSEMLLTFPRASKNINFLFKLSKATVPNSFW